AITWRGSPSRDRSARSTWPPQGRWRFTRWPGSAELEGERGSQPQASLLRGMEMDVRPRPKKDWGQNSGGGLVAQARSVEVGDVVHLRVEEVERVQREPRPMCQAETRLGVEQRGRSRAHAVVLDQRPGPEVPHRQAGPPRSQLVQGDARG